MHACVCSSPGIDGGGWTLVRRVKAGATWHPAMDHLVGSEPAYGTYSLDPTADESFGVPFQNMDYDQFLFATGDAQIWLIADREQVLEQFGGPTQRQIVMSSTSPTPYTAAWYNRAGNREDPWCVWTEISMYHARSHSFAYGFSRAHVRLLSWPMQDINGGSRTGDRQWHDCIW